MAGAKRVLVPLAESFEEIEAVTVVDVLRRAGAEVVVASLGKGPVRASRGVVVAPDVELDRVLDSHFDMIVLPGGMPGSKTLGEDRRIASLLDRAMGKKTWVGAICAAPVMVLEKNGVLKGRPATGYPSMRDDLPSYRDEPVVVSDNVITSQGPGTALPFALVLVRELLGLEKARSVAGDMLAPAPE